ncbi:MAG: sulfotransferase family protein [Rhodobacteraceae bacterium]|nr:sulfotransferase family protein [Paracoccaceae bacterium]
MTLQLIGAGFGRTGTESMRMALNILGIGPTHHMHEILDRQDALAMWKDLAIGGAPSWAKLFKGYNASVDWPSAAYWPALMAQYPDAKILLTWREPESWYRSFSKTIQPFLLAPENAENGSAIMINDRVFSHRAGDKAHVLAVYRRNIEQVFDEVPPGRLIMHRLGDGWGPLCAGLGVPQPNQPYPKSNSAQEFQDREPVDFSS